MTQILGAVVLDTRNLLTEGDIVRRLPPWCDDYAHITDGESYQGFGAMRNAAFQTAAECGFHWGLMLDTDMHYSEENGGIREILEETSADVIRIPERSRSYWGDRIFRLPLSGEFVGVVHEYYDAHKYGLLRLGYPTFWEDEKDQGQLLDKAQRDRDLLQMHEIDGPYKGRDCYYLADAHEILGERNQAMRWFAEAAIRSDWDEERAWSWYRLATLRANDGDYRSSIGACTNGLAAHAGVAELAWLAGWCCVQLHEWYQAIRWERMALSISNRYGTDAVFDRDGFQNREEATVKPWDVLDWVYGVLGDTAKAIECRAKAKYMRERLP